MHFSDILSLFFFILILFLVSPVLGKYIAKYSDRNVSKFEMRLFGLLRIKTDPQTTRDYLKDILWLSLFSFLFFFITVYFFSGASQPMSWHLAFNTAISFMTNTNWQAYSGEVSLTPFMQMLGCTVQNFVSAGTGIAVFIALSRALRNRTTDKIGNFWLDLTRSIFYLLLPLSILLTIFLIPTGVVQTFKTTINYETMEGISQALPVGPVASQVAIKQLGTNGGGYFGVNSAHPFENPTPFSNFLQVISILLIPCALVFTFGHMLKKIKHAWMIFFVMSFLWSAGLVVSLWSELQPSATNEITSVMEGKETRFSPVESILWSTATTAASNGSVNSMHSSLSPISGMVAMFNIMLGEIIFGGVGSGMYGMVIFIILTIFLCGLMVGRTPEYLQKKIDAYDMKLVLIALIVPSCTILFGSALSLLTDTGMASKLSNGPHGLSEILYAWASAAGNNGSAFAGLNGNTVFYNLLLGIAMLIGRFGVLIPVMFLAGSFSSKKMMSAEAGQMNTESGTFGIILTAVILIIGALTFFPALLLAPVAEYLIMIQGLKF